MVQRHRSVRFTTHRRISLGQKLLTGIFCWTLQTASRDERERTARRPQSARAGVFFPPNKSELLLLLLKRAAAPFSAAASTLLCVADIALFIRYEKFRACVISPSAPQRQISKHILEVCFVTPVILLLLLRCVVPCSDLTRPQLISADQWGGGIKPALAPSAPPISPPPRQLPHEQRGSC